MDVKDLATEVKMMPRFCKGKYIITRLAPSKDKEVSDNLMATMNLISYQTLIEEEGEEAEWSEPITTIKVDRLEDGELAVEFPEGMGGLFSMMYSGPYGFRFKDEETDKWFRIANEKYTREYFMTNYGEDYETPEQFDAAFTDYLIDLYNFKLQKNFNIDVNVELGLVSSFYRKVLDKKEGQKYADVMLTKYDADLGSLSGESEVISEDIVEAIVDGITAAKDGKLGKIPF